MRHPRLPALVMLAGLFTTPAFGAQPPWELEPSPRVIEDRVRLEVSLFAASFDTNVRADPSAKQIGTTVNAENDFGLASNKVLPQVELTLFAGKRHFFRLSGLSLRRDGQHVLDEEVVYDNNTYHVGERVDSNLDITMAGLTYGYRFVRAERLEVDGTFGIQVASVDVNAVVPTRVIRESDSAAAPVPLIGLEGHYDLSSRWALEARAQYLRVIVSDVRGSLLDMRYAANWRMNQHLCFGLGYRIFRIDADSHTTSHPGMVGLKTAGPVLYAQASL